MVESEKVREQRVRRELTKDSSRLQKTPARSWLRTHWVPRAT